MYRKDVFLNKIQRCFDDEHFAACCGSRYNKTTDQKALVNNNIGIILRESKEGDVEHKSEKVDIDIVKTRVGNITVSIRHAW